MVREQQVYWRPTHSLRLVISHQHFSTRDEKFAVHLSDKVLSEAKHLCKKRPLSETGGIVIGYYTRDHKCAVIASLDAPPSGSTAGATWFERSATGLNLKLRSLWSKVRRRYYLGEWHFHPLGTPIPSQRDTHQMVSISKDPKYRCPEPILVILAGDSQGSLQVGVFVFADGKGPLSLTNSS